VGFASLYSSIPGSAVYNTARSGSIQNCWDAFYFSVVTFTTLGFGDIIAGSHGLARMLVITEVSLGYISLGVLISLIMKKLDL
jgi:uncharacterized membrane protein YtjA (UPF0391 family)